MREKVFKEVTKPVFDYEIVKCDLCGYDEDETWIIPVAVHVDPDGCAGTIVTRDVCGTC